MKTPFLVNTQGQLFVSTASNILTFILFRIIVNISMQFCRIYKHRTQPEASGVNVSVRVEHIVGVQ